MAKIMLFIDGTWLYANTPRLSEASGHPDFRIDFGKLPRVLAEEVGSQLGTRDLDVVRTCLFGSIPANYDLRDEDGVQRRRDFFDMLKEEYHYEVELFPINLQGRRLRKQDRDPNDTFEAKEKCVDISLATTMLYYAAIPYAYDIAIAVLGDRDFMPVLQHVRRLGKRVAIASIKGSCAPEYVDPRDEARVKDFDIIWLTDLLEKLELRYERHRRRCESPIHQGDREVWTTYYPRKGRPFYCDACREAHNRQKQEEHRELVSAGAERNGLEVGLPAIGQVLAGRVKRKLADRGYAFIEWGHSQYYFNFTDMHPTLSFDDVEEGTEVEFEVKRNPSEGKAGAAMNVRRKSE